MSSPAPGEQTFIARTAMPLTPPANRWSAGAEDFAHMRAGAVWSAVTDLSVLEFDGPDAVCFLQSQTTADIAAMSTTTWQLGGYCTAKGRLLAVFQAWKWESASGNSGRVQSGLRLLVPSDIAQATLRRLSMYVLRSKVRISDVSGSWAVLALCGSGSTQALLRAGADVPVEPWQLRRIGADECIVRLPSGASCPERLLLLVPAVASDAWRKRLEPLPAVDPGVWWWSQIDAAIPCVFANTSELFVPQGLNLELLGAVSFRKGCYPGQEIVARSQYLGNLRRRLGLAHAAHVGPGADVFHDGNPIAVGRVVMSAAAPGGGWDLLFECPTALTTHGSLHAGAPDAPALVLQSLPYPIFDPTA